MAELPDPVVRYLRGVLLPGLVFIRTDSLGRVLQVGGMDGALQTPGFEGLTEGSDVTESLDLLVGLLPVRGAPVVLPMIENAVPGMERATVHLVPAEDDGTWIVLVDSSAEATRRQTVQQRGNDEALLGAQLERQRRLAEARSAELREFSFYVSHDLKGPLRAIRSQQNRLAESGADAEALGAVERALDDADALIQDLLALAGVGEAIRWEQLDSGALVQRLIDDLTMGPDEEVLVAGDWPELATSRTLFIQVLRNLIENGLKYSSAPKRVELFCESDKAWATIRVRDNGIGIEARYLDSIFRPFQRLHTADAYRGTGIGLAIVAKAVRLLGGTVRVESTPGIGSVFEMRVPLSAER